MKNSRLAKPRKGGDGARQRVWQAGSLRQEANRQASYRAVMTFYPIRSVMSIPVSAGEVCWCAL